MEETITFFNQWTKRPVAAQQEFTKPTCTVPDQSMTVQEIIAKFTRTGLVPRAYLQTDEGGNTAVEPDFDPMDMYSEVMDAFKAPTGSDQAPSEPGSEPAPTSEPGAGNGGD